MGNIRRIMLRVAYDGTGYCGWQVQPNGITIEEVLNRELTALLGTGTAVIGASRTDSGVHALGNVCVFDTDSRIPGEKFSYALNAGLPQDIVIQESREVPLDFHPRRCGCDKTYEYRIYNAVFPNPLLRRYSHFVYRGLDTGAMRRAAAYLVGEHDFKSFCSANTQVKETVRTINYIELLESPAPLFHMGDCKDMEAMAPGRLRAGMSGALPGTGLPEVNGRMVTLRINGNGFLYNMVRIIAGTLIEIGCHWYGPEKVPDILAARNRADAGATAPACGLALVGIHYPELLLQLRK